METPAPIPPAAAARRTRRPRAWTALLAALVGAAACHDAPTDPLVGVVARESYAALALGVTFSDPGAWWSPEDPEGEGSRALDAWRASWDLPPEEGRRAREGSYGALARGLAQTLQVAGIERELALLGEALAQAEALAVQAPLPPHVAAGILQAGLQRAAAAGALSRGERAGALEALLRGGDALREVGPEAAARGLQAEVERRVGRLPEDAPYSLEDLERLRRLARGARQALDAGDWVLAIRRSFYAKGILDGNG